MTASAAATAPADAARRGADHPIHPLFTQRWSPRAYTGETVSDGVLQSVFEAARWAPSARNLQPWRFIVARPGEAAWEDFLAILFERNRQWARRASALVAVVSETLAPRDGVPAPSESHAFDTGAAWANFAHQALLLGWHTRAMGGIDRAAARTTLALPEDFAVHVVVALGRQGALDDLPPEFHAQENPSSRRPLGDTVFAGRFGVPAFVPEKDAR